MISKLILTGILIILGAIGQATPTPPYAQEYLEFSKFINQFITQNPLSTEEKNDLKKLITHFEPNQKVLHLMDYQAEKWPWWKYEQKTITPKRIQAGAEFLKKHQVILKQLQNTYPVPPEYLVAIIGLETSYGENMGNFNAFQTLSTLGFYYPRRAKFFQSELQALLKLAHQEQFNLKKLNGSYAGALGYPQFMPSSYLQYANNYFKKPNTDLFKDPETALASVANYLTKHGWKKNSFVVQPVQDLEKSESESHVKKIVSFQTIPDRPESLTHFLAGKNFYAIRKYNISDNYVLGVHTLAQKIREQIKS